MTDLTSTFDGLLQAHSAAPTKREPFSVDNLDDFIKEAYTINIAIRSLHTHLRGIRQSYLSTAQPRRTTLLRHHQHDGDTSSALSRPLTDREREEIDASAKTMLRDLNAKIRQLSDAEQVRQDSEAVLIRKKYARGLGALGSWAAGDGGGGGLGGRSKSAEHRAAEERANSISTHRESVLWTLRQRLQSCVLTQQGMMEVRLNREMEKSRSVLAKAGGLEGMRGAEAAASFARRRAASQAASGESAPPPPGDAPPAYDPREGLSPEQIQMFEQENHDMLQHYESVLDQVRAAEKSLIEISELQTQLVTNLATQSAHIDQLVADAFNTTENVGGGNKQLKKATQKPSPAKYTFWATCGLCTILIVWDLLI
ncbi:hypothetical protein BX600DRAFT_29468 [Xylariales sp. PMI_506]|nr:hypothetical protein BX600DRAFT_29468 [Xylariales sp. PMI_506]